MPTENPRIQVTLDKETINTLTLMAEREELSMSAMAKKLIKSAMEYDEDYHLSKLAMERDTEDAVWVEDSDDIWE